MTPLPHDITRCYGYLCIKKQQCQRFTTMRIDPPAVLSYVNSMIDEHGDCDAFIYVSKRPAHD